MHKGYTFEVTTTTTTNADRILLCQCISYQIYDYNFATVEFEFHDATRGIRGIVKKFAMHEDFECDIYCGDIILEMYDEGNYE